MTDATWTTEPAGYDTTTIGRYTVIVWTGSSAPDLDDGYQVCEAYIPTTDRKIPGGRMIMRRRTLNTRDREAARVIAVRVATYAIADYEAWEQARTSTWESTWESTKSATKSLLTRPGR